MRFPLAALGLLLLPVIACSDDDPPPPRVFMSALLGPGTEKGVNDAARCQLTTMQWLELGRSESPIETGTRQSESMVTVTCKVAPSGSGFQVAASATLERAGSVTILGDFTDSGTQTGITGTFTRGVEGRYKQSDCTVEYDKPGMGVAKGRVWGTITCPRVDNQLGQDRTCQASAEFRFERCDEK